MYHSIPYNFFIFLIHSITRSIESNCHWTSNYYNFIITSVISFLSALIANLSVGVYINLIPGLGVWGCDNCIRWSRSDSCHICRDSETNPNSNVPKIIINYIVYYAIHNYPTLNCVIFLYYIYNIFILYL